MAETCIWTENVDGCWETACGRSYMIDGTAPSEYGVRFCCYCGKPLEERPYFGGMGGGEEDDDDEAT